MMRAEGCRSFCVISVNSMEIDGLFTLMVYNRRMAAEREWRERGGEGEGGEKEEGGGWLSRWVWVVGGGAAVGGGWGGSVGFRFH